MPLIKFFSLVCIAIMVWLGIVHVFHNYGGAAGFTALITAIIVGRSLSKKTLKRMKAAKQG